MIHLRFGPRLASGIALLALTVGTACTAAAQTTVTFPPAPDTTSSPAGMSGRLIDDLPVDSVTGALLFQPGTGIAADGALSLRGGAGRESATYIDDIPVTPGTRRVRLSPATNSVEDATAVTGPLSAALGNGIAGAVLMRTRSIRGARFSYETDGPLGASSLGLNRFEGRIGLGLGRHLSLFAGGALNGQASAEPGFGARAAPIFVRAGIDTTVTAGEAQVDIFNYAVARGSCDTFAASVNPGIASNYGLDCTGDRTPLSATSSHQLLLKADYAAGRSTVGVIGLRSRDQSRLFDYLTSYLPSNAFGQGFTSDLIGVTLTHRMSRDGVLRASLSRQTDQQLGGPLSAAGERASRDPSLGLMVAPLGFQYDFKTFPVDSQLVENYRANLPGTRRSPYDLENRDQYSTFSRYRSDAYGLTGFAEGGGPVGLLTLHRERRTVATASGEWQVSPNSRFQAGGALTRYSVNHYVHGLTAQAGSDVYIVAPRALSLFAEDAFHYGEVTVSAGIRYERFSSNADRPYALDTVASSPTFNSYQPFPRISSYAGTFNGDSLVTFVRDQSHSAFLPRFRLTYEASPGTELRAGYSRQAQLPDFSALYGGINTDLAITSARNPYGSDLDLERAWIAEVGGRHRLGASTTVDLALFHRSSTSGNVARLVSLADPTRHNSRVDLFQFSNSDSLRVSGGEIRIERRAGLLTGTAGYAYQHSSAPGGFITPDSRPHTLSAALALQVRNTAAFAGFRFASGLPYFPCEVLGNESALSDGGACATGGLLGIARLPALKQLDLRVTQSLRLGGRVVTAYVDARNVLNFRNVLRVYSVSGATTSAVEAQTFFAGDSSNFANEARANALYQADGSIDLRFAGTGAAGCAAYVTQSGEPGAPSCVSLIRAEQRFGNGDGVFDLAEQRSAISAEYAVFRGEQFFTGAPRRVRVGLQIGL